MKSVFGGAAAIVFGALSSVTGGAQAQNQMGSSSSGLSNPTNVVQNFSVQTVGPVLNELGMPWQVQQLDDNGAQYILAAGGSVQFIIFFAACQDEAGARCVGMHTVTFFQGMEANPQTVQAFNANIPFITAGVSQDNVAYVSRYDIADFGIPRGNIASSLVNFLAVAQNFADELAAGHQTVSLDGYASDLSASRLNRQTAEKVLGGSVSSAPAGGYMLHQTGLEEGAEMIQLMLKDDSVRRNTIKQKVQNERD
ncbi:YbjN domain-containing protein [Hyphococcus sp.]|uniref:YbjN domain-containing protein n=1 Tax=Hyphococcus sp. TaxID=2038636 RepID=UPI003CCBD23C